MSNSDDKPVRSGSESANYFEGDDATVSSASIESALIEGASIDAGGLAEVEDGYDLFTHGGGSLEAVEGFDLFKPMLGGIGTAERYVLPGDWQTMPLAETLQYNGRQESVCGPDDRVQMSLTSAPPWRMICQLLITLGNDQRSRGTGWFISPRTVMTAGHCVHSADNGGWVKSIEVGPGMSGELRPFGSATSKAFRSVVGWVEGAKNTHDYGCIILPESARLGDKTGWFGFANLPDTELEELLANNSGYPGDKSFGTQWYNAGRIVSMETRRIAYMIDTAPGQSGSPTWRYSKATGQRHAVGVHAYGGCANKSTRINAAVYANMQKWKSQGS